MKGKIILIADPDRDVLSKMGNAFHEHGYDVRAALDGSKALEKAILVHPELILFDTSCQLIPFKKFIQILRSNPHTEQIPVIITGEKEPDDSTIWGYREAFIHKPFNIDEVLSLVAATFRKMATAQEVQEEGREIEGNLTQIALVDLLQIFGLNRKTGLLLMKVGDQEGKIFLHEGVVAHASLGRHRGEKALFRLLQWHEGTFAFIPEQLTGEVNIRRSTDVLLLEGFRQLDDLAKLRSELPAGNVRLAVVAELKSRYEGLHPVTQEILDLLEFYSTVEDLIEHSRVSDYETCRAIRTLLDKGVLYVLKEEVQKPKEEEPLLSQDRLYELKVQLGTETPQPSRVTRAKICLLCPDSNLLKELVSGMHKIPGMDLSGRMNILKRGFGHLGILLLSENLQIDWMVLPVQPPLRPLWHPLGVGAVGGLVVRPRLDDQALYHANLLAQEFSKSFGIAVVQISHEELSEAGAGERAESNFSTKVRHSIIRLLQQVGQKIPLGKTA